MNKYIISALLTIVLISIGQILFKLGANTFDFRFDNINIRFFINNKYFLSAIFIYILSMVLWIYTLSKIELSFGYLMMSLSFPIILLLSSIFLNEKITLIKGLSVTLIILANIILIVGEKI